MCQLGLRGAGFREACEYTAEGLFIFHNDGTLGVYILGRQINQQCGARQYADKHSHKKQSVDGFARKTHK